MRTQEHQQEGEQEPTQISKWLSKRAAKGEQAVLIETALLDENPRAMASYYFYRMRYFLIRCMVAAAVFAIEIKILVEGFGMAFFQQSLGARTLVLLLTGAWWAGLELMRSEIRHQKRAERPYLIPGIIVAWQNRAWALALTIVSAGALGLVIVFGLSPEKAWSPYNLYLMVLLARLGVEIPLRAYHSSVYATRRVYRPLWWILFAELLGLACFLTLKPTIGPWSVAIAGIISLTASTSISYHYITKTFNYLGYNSAIERLASKSQKRVRLPAWKEVAKAALPLTLFQLDSILVLLLILGHQKGAGGEGTILLLGLCLPLLQASQEWSRLLYFDYKKLEVKTHRLLREKFEAGTKYIGLLLSLCLWLTIPVLWAIATGGWLGFPPPWQILLVLLANGYAGQQAIRTFSAGEAGNLPLLAWGTSLLIGLTVLGLWDMEIGTKLVLISLTITAHGWGLMVCLPKTMEDASTKKLVLPPTTWLMALKESEGPVIGGVVIVGSPHQDKGVAKSETYLSRETARHIQQSRAGRRTKVTAMGNPPVLLWFAPAPNEAADKALWSIQDAICHGGASSVKDSTGWMSANASELLERMVEETKEREIQIRWRGLPPLKKVFQAEPNKEETPPKGTWTFRFDGPLKPGEEGPNETVRPQDGQEIVHMALEFHRNLGTETEEKKRKRWEVACEERDGSITAIHANTKVRRWNKTGQREFPNWMTWARQVAEGNLRNAWTGVDMNQIARDKQRE
jgi:hypothetical protein